MSTERRAILVLALACACTPGSSSMAPSSGETGDGSSTAQPGTAGDTTTSPGTSDGVDDSSDTSAEGDASSSSSDGGDSGWEWELPPGFPPPVVPEDNPMSAAKVELGRHLFYDVRMSGGGTFACATCHLQELAFTDGRVTAVGETGQVHRRNSMGLANVGYAASLTWAHPLLLDLERQALVPMFGDDPIELGIDSERELLAALAVEPRYEQLFADAFPDEPEPSAAHIVQGLAAFQRTIISGDSPFDRWFAGDETAISESAARGYALFNGHPFECFHCHVGFNLSDAVYWDPSTERDLEFHNTGLYNVDGLGGYPLEDPGLVEITMDAADMGKFRTPSLRNVAVTGPYMHDGSIATLDEVLDHYAAGGRTITEGPNAGVGSTSPAKDSLISGFAITDAERADILAFLESLTDDELLVDPQLADPW